METTPPFPERSNVAGLIIPPNGDLRPLLEVLKPITEDGKAYIYRSGYNGAKTLHLRTDWADLDSEPLENSRIHLFNGAVAGTLEQAAAFVQRVAELFSSVGAEYALEVYDEDQKLYAEFLSAGRDIRREE
jgi:hypothetical protein